MTIDGTAEALLDDSSLPGQDRESTCMQSVGGPEGQSGEVEACPVLLGRGGVFAGPIEGSFEEEIHRINQAIRAECQSTFKWTNESAYL